MDLMTAPPRSSATGVLRLVTGEIALRRWAVASLVANIVIVVTVGIFLASDPQLYRRGVLHLVPIDKRQRAAEILDALGRGLWMWLIGQGLAMSAVAVLSGVGLWLIGVPLALALGLIAGLLDFIPYVGPWLGAAPAILLALAQGPTEAVQAASGSTRRKAAALPISSESFSRLRRRRSTAGPRTRRAPGRWSGKAQRPSPRGNSVTGAMAQDRTSDRVRWSITS